MPPETESAIRSRFRQLSALEEGKGVGNTAQIDRRARQDETLLNQLLRAAGYYDARVSTRIEDEKTGRLGVSSSSAPACSTHCRGSISAGSTPLATSPRSSDAPSGWRRASRPIRIGSRRVWSRSRPSWGMRDRLREDRRAQAYRRP
ncbi:hypothetical protein ACFSTI_27590 [Rhizorhabdus histidinilytica]